MKKIFILFAAFVLFSMLPGSEVFAQKKTKDKIEQPEYPGGLKALHKFIASEVRYPSEARLNNEIGEVLIGFTVGIDGHITGVRVLKSVSESLDKEAMRVISKTGYWYPGKKNGKPVRFEMSIPINFKVLFEHRRTVDSDDDNYSVGDDALKDVMSW
jgi:TonB family protein